MFNHNKGKGILKVSKSMFIKPIIVLITIIIGTGCSTYESSNKGINETSTSTQTIFSGKGFKQLIDDYYGLYLDEFTGEIYIEYFEDKFEFAETDESNPYIIYLVPSGNNENLIVQLNVKYYSHEPYEIIPQSYNFDPYVLDSQRSFLSKKSKQCFKNENDLYSKFKSECLIEYQIDYGKLILSIAESEDFRIRHLGIVFVLTPEMRKMVKQVQRIYDELNLSYRLTEGPGVIMLNDQLVDIEKGESRSWACSDILNDLDIAFNIGFIKNSDSFGYVLYDGTNLGERTHYNRIGLDHRWDWGLDEDGNFRYSIILKTNGTALYYDFAIAIDEEKKKSSPRQTYSCFETSS